MSWNVPDDWNSYYYSCGCHASEGGCSCKEGQLEEAERPWLEESGYELDGGIWSQTISIKVRTYRRDHQDGGIKKGDKYREHTSRCIDDEDGSSWIVKRKRRISPKAVR